MNTYLDGTLGYRRVHRPSLVWALDVVLANQGLQLRHGGIAETSLAPQLLNQIASNQSEWRNRKLS